jgi:hypothetical protein
VVAGLALALGVLWWVRRRELAVPIALGACAALYLISLPSSGYYSQAKALTIAAPLAMRWWPSGPCSPASPPGSPEMRRPSEAAVHRHGGVGAWCA